MRLRYLEKSRTTATLQHWPARLVPPPRDSTGTSCARQTATARTTYGTCGVKVWVFKGEIMAKNDPAQIVADAIAPAQPEQPPARKPRKTPARTGARRATASQT